MKFHSEEKENSYGKEGKEDKEGPGQEGPGQEGAGERDGPRHVGAGSPARGSMKAPRNPHACEIEADFLGIGHAIPVTFHCRAEDKDNIRVTITANIMTRSLVFTKEELAEFMGILQRGYIACSNWKAGAVE